MIEVPGRACRRAPPRRESAGSDASIIEQFAPGAAAMENLINNPDISAYYTFLHTLSTIYKKLMCKSDIIAGPGGSISAYIE